MIERLFFLVLVYLLFLLLQHLAGMWDTQRQTFNGTHSQGASAFPHEHLLGEFHGHLSQPLVFLQALPGEYCQCPSDKWVILTLSLQVASRQVFFFFNFFLALHWVISYVQILFYIFLINYSMNQWLQPYPLKLRSETQPQGGVLLLKCLFFGTLPQSSGKGCSCSLYLLLLYSLGFFLSPWQLITCYQLITLYIKHLLFKLLCGFCLLI